MSQWENFSWTHQNVAQKYTLIGHDIEQEMGSLHLTTVCWSRWFDRDNPSGTGDWETLSDLRTAYPGAICDEPLYIEAVTVDTMTPALATGQNIFM